MILAKPDLERALGELRTRLIDEFRGRVDDAGVRRQFDDAVASMAGARVRLYVPVLAYRLTRDRLSHRSSAAAAHGIG